MRVNSWEGWSIKNWRPPRRGCEVGALEEGGEGKEKGTKAWGGQLGPEKKRDKWGVYRGGCGWVCFWGTVIEEWEGVDGGRYVQVATQIRK